jgi:hypothetical protein
LFHHPERILLATWQGIVKARVRHHHLHTSKQTLFAESLDLLHEKAVLVDGGYACPPPLLPRGIWNRLFMAPSVPLQPWNAPRSLSVYGFT